MCPEVDSASENEYQGISPGVKADGAYGWRTTTLLVPNVEKIRDLNLPGTPLATSACRGITLLFTFYQSQGRRTLKDSILEKFSNSTKPSTIFNQYVAGRVEWWYHDVLLFYLMNKQRR